MRARDLTGSPLACNLPPDHCRNHFTEHARHWIISTTGETYDLPVFPRRLAKHGGQGIAQKILTGLLAQNDPPRRIGE
jgi:hypothetical protein